MISFDDLCKQLYVTDAILYTIELGIGFMFIFYVFITLTNSQWIDYFSESLGTREGYLPAPIHFQALIMNQIHFKVYRVRYH